VIARRPVGGWLQYDFGHAEWGVDQGSLKLNESGEAKGGAIYQGRDSPEM
jgi:hypothetical protein